jgi:hypothetical protein
MPIRRIKEGQLVFCIEKDRILEGRIEEIINGKEMIIHTPPYSKPIKAIYGVDFYFTYNKAKKVLQNLEREQKKLSEGFNLNNLIEPTSYSKNRNCEACGLPIGSFGHCGCSF